MIVQYIYKLPARIKGRRGIKQRKLDHHFRQNRLRTFVVKILYTLSKILMPLKSYSKFEHIAYVFIFVASMTGCRNRSKMYESICERCDAETKMEQASNELEIFDKNIEELYDQIEENPNKVISTAELLIRDIKTKSDTNNVRRNKLVSLCDLRTETFYKMGEFRKSIAEIYNTENTIGETFTLGSSDFARLACNYVKLKEYDKAKEFIDSVGKGWYLAEYILANYYEVIGKKEKAIKQYCTILKRNDQDHYFF